MKLSEMFKFKPFGEVDTSIGTLAVFDISAGEHSKVVMKSSPSLEAIPATAFVTRLLPCIAHPIDLLNEDRVKPARPSLTDEQLAALPDQDINAIIALFLENQPQLYRKSEWTRSTNHQGQVVMSQQYGDVEHPKIEGESNVDYLHRLFVLDEARTKRQMSQMTSSILETARFSAGLTDSIQKTLSMGESVSRAIEAIRPTVLPTPVEIMPPLPTIDYVAIARDAEDARWAPIDAVNERLDKLVEITSTSGEFMVQMNQTQTQIAAEIKVSGEEAAKIGKDSLWVTKWGVWLTIVVVALTIISLLISASSWRASTSDKETANDYAEQMVGGLVAVKEAILQQSEQQASDRQKTIDELQSRIVHLEEALRQLKSNQTPDEGTIE